MDKTPYYLHGVIIHDGSAQSGHYFAFIQDHFQKKWRKYNDIRITDVSEEDVFKEGNGGFHNSSAYLLVYVDSDIQK